MLTTLLIPLLGIILKLVPVLYQLKIIKSEADLAKLQAQIETAIKKAEAQALDANRLKKQHSDNLDEIAAKRAKVWPKGPSTPAPVTTGATTPVPSTINSGVTMICPINCTSNVIFWVDIKGLPDKGDAAIWCGDYVLHVLCGTGRQRTPVCLTQEGARKLYIKLDGVIVAETNIVVNKNPEYS